MSSQKRDAELREKQPLLREDGQPDGPGYCKRNLYHYNKENIRGARWRLKEWDYYQISDGRFMVQLNFFNIGVVSALSAELCDLTTGERWSDAVLEPLTVGRNPLSGSADGPFLFEYRRGGRYGCFRTEGTTRTLVYEGTAKGKPFTVRLTAETQPEQESLTTVTPFRQKNCFYYTQKLNCMPCAGTVGYEGKAYTFERESTFMVMDWGRGVWPWRSSWYWANGSTRLPDGKLFGFELTWGFGETGSAEATALFYDGKCHKLGRVYLERDPEKNGWMAPWHFLSEDGRLDLTMTPFFDHRAGVIVLWLVGMKSHQLHGRFNGHVVLDDGRRIEIKDMYAFAEKVHNCW